MLSQNNLLILGAGQYGVMAKEIAEAMGVFGRIAFLDDSFNTSDGTDIIGTIADLPKIAEQFKFGFVAIGNPTLRRKLTEQLKQNNFALATLVHPTAYVSPSALLEPGCCVEPNATVQTAAIVKQATFIASGSVIRHNAVVGEFSHIDCNAVVDTLAVVPTGTHILALEAYRA